MRVAIEVMNILEMFAPWFVVFCFALLWGGFVLCELNGEFGRHFVGLGLYSVLAGRGIHVVKCVYNSTIQIGNKNSCTRLLESYITLHCLFLLYI